MTKLLSVTLTICALALTIGLGFLGYIASTTLLKINKLVDSTVPVISSVNTTINHLDSTVDQLNGTISSANKTLAYTKPAIDGIVNIETTINRNCGGSQSCGTLADVAKTLNTVRGTFGNIEIAAQHEDKNLTLLDSQEQTIFDSLHSTSNSADKTIADFDALLTSPDLTGTIHNTDTITANLGQTTGDFQNKFHSILYPPPCHGAICNWKKVWTVIDTGSKLVEPIYFGQEIVSGFSGH